MERIDFLKVLELTMLVTMLIGGCVSVMAQQPPARTQVQVTPQTKPSPSGSAANAAAGMRLPSGAITGFVYWQMSVLQPQSDCQGTDSQGRHLYQIQHAAATARDNKHFHRDGSSDGLLGAGHSKIYGLLFFISQHASKRLSAGIVKRTSVGSRSDSATLSDSGRQLHISPTEHVELHIDRRRNALREQCFQYQFQIDPSRHGASCGHYSAAAERIGQAQRHAFKFWGNFQSGHQCRAPKHEWQCNTVTRSDECCGYPFVRHTAWPALVGKAGSDENSMGAIGGAGDTPERPGPARIPGPADSRVA